MTSSPSKIGVGIVGLSASGGWASEGHLPALQAAGGFEVRGLVASSTSSAKAAGEAYGVPLAFDRVEDLAVREEIDLVVVAVKVPRHRELVLPALAAGKAVFCEWPLANGLGEAVDLVEAAKGLPNFVGLQGRSSPAVRYLRDLVVDGYVGEVISTTLISTSPPWGMPVNSKTQYLVDRSNGATLLTIPFGHVVDSFSVILGDLTEISATTATRRPRLLNVDTGQDVTVTAEDQILVAGTLAGGAVASIDLRGGTTRTTKMLWEINGTGGDLQVTGSGGTLFGTLTIRGARGDDDVEMLEVPADYDSHPQLAGSRIHAVAHAYDRIRGDLLHGSHDAPDFTNALARHQLIEQIQRSAAIGTRLPVPS